MSHDHAHHANLPKRAAIFAVTIASTLILAKLYGWWRTESLSLFSSLIDSVLDVMISIVNLCAIYYAAKPADNEHRFGHTSIEDIAGLVQAAFIAGSSAFILLEAVNRLFNPSAIPNSDLGINIMLFSIVMTSLLILYQRYVLRRSESLVVEADSLHYLTDVLVNIGVIVSLYLSQAYGMHLADPILAILIALYIFKTAWSIGIRAYNHLMDRELPDEEKEKILNVIHAHDGVKGIHQLKTRAAGSKVFIQFHLELDGKQTLFASHKIAEAIEVELEGLFPKAEIIVHQDPV